MQPIKAIYKASFTLIILTLVASCAPPRPTIALKQYTPSQQREIAKARNALPDDSPLLSPLQEWENLRQRLK